MRGAIAIRIRTCRGGPSAPSADAPPGFRPSIRPSSLAPIPARHPNLKNSNREALRRVRADDSARRNDDVINVTHTRQTTRPRSNREGEALFSNRVRADDSARHYIARAVNRLRDCGEIDSARRYRKIERFTRRLNLKNSNRESRLSDREESHALQTTINPSASTARRRGNFQPSKSAKSIKNHPQSLFRLERTSTVYFQQLTQNLNDTMFRLERSAQRTRIERRNQKTKPIPTFFRIAFSPLNGYPRRDLHSRRRAACACDH
jgi:hypothetical protein